MIFLLIGAIVGILMGITGAGGAIIAIPLFQSLVGVSLKDASVLSLIAVILGTLINLAGNFKSVKWKMAGGFAIFGTVANYISIPLKDKTHEMLIATLLIGIGLFSLWSVWRSKVQTDVREVQIKYLPVVLVGLLLGIITTLTGLGGGVLLIPILLNFFKMNYEEALPTSLGTIFLISLSSLLFQINLASKLIHISDFILLSGGVLLSFLLLKAGLKYLNDKKRLLLRKTVFSLATIASLISIVIKTF